MEDRVYHIYNRGNNREKLFYSKEHYELFLELFKKHPGTLADTYCYCLIPNHFHFLIRVRKNSGENDFVSQIRRWLISYAMTVNRQMDRKGHLLTRPINRIEVTDEAYLKHVVRYIHLNPLKHGLTIKWDKYQYSSYRIFLSSHSQHFLAKEDAMVHFNNDLLEFIDFHHSEHDDGDIERFIIEEKR
jgi:REP element-mobilizing transposase RayT